MRRGAGEEIMGGEKNGGGGKELIRRTKKGKKQGKE